MGSHGRTRHFGYLPYVLRRLESAEVVRLKALRLGAGLPESRG